MSEYNDHDLLIELRTDMKNVIRDIKEIKEDTKSTLMDHEGRLRNIEEKKIPRIENRLSYWAGGLAVAQAVIAYLVTRFFK